MKAPPARALAIRRKRMQRRVAGSAATTECSAAILGHAYAINGCDASINRPSAYIIDAVLP
eukprot:1767888-Rhodomonas_salina.1